MTVYISGSLAQKKLVEAAERARRKDYKVPPAIETKIEQIIRHTHLTYKYILLTGLLAKATNPNANPLVLQAGSSLPGAFDARSLCHSVVVPYEQNDLEKRLGGSNEPFLNKPARFPHLSMDNAVRRGRDREVLGLLIQLFNALNENPDNGESLVAAIWHILSLESRVVKFKPKQPGSATKRGILKLTQSLLSRSCEGESLALAVAMLFDLLVNPHGPDLVVKSHPTNQSGASSKEISDVDVFEADGVTLRYCCETKDKNFTRADVDHAVSKVMDHGHSSMIFIYGPNSKSSENLSQIVVDFEKMGFDLTFVDAASFAAGVVCLSQSVSWDYVTSIINKHLEMMRAKEPTIAHCRESLARL